MPVTLIAAATCGDAALAASQVLGFSAYAAALPTLLLDLSGGGPRPGLIPELPLSPEDAPRVLRGLGASVAAFVRVGADRKEIEPLLPYANAVVITATRIPAGLAESFALYRSLTELRVEGRSGRVIEPWLLPVGWSSTKLPMVRLRDWQRDLAKLGQDDLRCLPLILPWASLGAVGMADPARLQAVGARLLHGLAAVAAGREPARPERGLEDGDPWPTPPAPVAPPEPPLRLAVAGLRPRLRLVHGA
ncbi:MAG TPA: hypothetical protein VG848_07455 [Acetobacteraceae bacterium]|nr:hypothetical protein [Acetobacteraceae bacterium]